MTEDQRCESFLLSERTGQKMFHASFSWNFDLSMTQMYKNLNKQQYIDSEFQYHLYVHDSFLLFFNFRK